ncbi:MAG: hypothetical protein AVDCRST_MAG93-7592 [uncultured Chloroflexia bacterium]|uniref:Uncharacterized protein n=1 Tax=uncultured Chloroflexia bacterium TaxID=1672391 RepID=A0A6J4MKR8_9CHLR|nr:MAG: hypothetical protein AVDCRST_MAG93-7592 [uncultured Chloroflexia bacterium]
MDCKEAHAEKDFCYRLLLLFIAQPSEGWEADLQEPISREIERLGVPASERAHGE